MSHLRVQLSAQTLLATLTFVCLFFTAFMWPNLGETTPCSVAFREKFLFRHHLGWRDKPQSILNGSHMGFKCTLCSCLDSRAVFQAPCWGWCDCRSPGGHSHARVYEAPALEKTSLPTSTPGLYCWRNLTASRQTCPLSEWLLTSALPPLVVSVDEKYVALGSLLRRIRSGWVHLLFFYLPQ